ncbi:MAG: sulfatase [Planctomycetota bacterium]|nr:sulfatase [Planctomycetota bacterium]
MCRTVVVVCSIVLSSPLAMAASRPNMLIVLTDDQRWDAMGVVQQEQGDAARFRWFETPNLDRLAADGTRFRNAFVVCSLCSPSRAAFLTGRYNHANGIIDNKTPLPADAVTYASLLRESGYTTGYAGKWHMDGQKGQRPGFDWSASFVGQGRYMDCPVEVNGETTPTKGWIDDVSTDYAIDFIKRQTDAKPFCLVVGYKTPHGPRTKEAVPERLRGSYANQEIAPAVNAAARPPYLEGNAPDAAPRPRRRQRPGDTAPSPVYFELLKGIDENVGRMLTVLEESGRRDDTIVVFTSDNGYFLGDHGVGDKRAAYDESLRIPLLISVPGGGKGRTADAMVLNVDLAPTLLDFAGVSVPDAMQGRSLRACLEGDAPDDWRTSFFYEYYEEPPYKVPSIHAVRTANAKLIRYPGHDDWTELFDLKADPYEMHNLIDDQAQADLRMRLQSEFDRQAKAVGLPSNALPESQPN